MAGNSTSMDNEPEEESPKRLSAKGSDDEYNKDSTKHEENGDANHNDTDEEDAKPTSGGRTSNKRKLTTEGDSGNEENGDEESAKKSKRNRKSKSKSKPAATPKRGASKSRASKKSKADKENDEEYEVEKIIDVKTIKGKVHYLIRWKGYSASSDTWEPKNTVSCPDLIAKFEDEQKDKDKKKTANKPAKKGAKKKVSTTPAKKTKKLEWEDKDAEYEVERILEVQHKKKGSREFLIHWKGWPSKYDSWEPEEHLNCADLIKKFMEKVDTARQVDSRSLRTAPESTRRFTLQTQAAGRRLSKRRGQKQRVRYDNTD